MVARRKGSTRPLIRAAIFDLDDTLYDCLRQRVETSHRAAAEAMVRAGVRATVDQVLAIRMKAFIKDPHLKSIDAEVARAFGADNLPELSRIAHEAYFSHPVGELTLFAGSLKVLRTLHGRGVRNFIVSYGEVETQQAKIAALGLHEEGSVERVLFADRQKKMTKEPLFHEILGTASVVPEQFLVVGDRPSAEIAIGKRLGMHTVRRRGGEFALLEPQAPEEVADFEITEIDEILRLPYSFGQA